MYVHAPSAIGLGGREAERSRGGTRGRGMSMSVVRHWKNILTLVVLAGLVVEALPVPAALAHVRRRAMRLDESRAIRDLAVDQVLDGDLVRDRAGLFPENDRGGNKSHGGGESVNYRAKQLDTREHKIQPLVYVAGGEESAGFAGTSRLGQQAHVQEAVAALEDSGITQLRRAQRLEHARLADVGLQQRHGDEVDRGRDRVREGRREGRDVQGQREGHFRTRQRRAWEMRCGG